MILLKISIGLQVVQGIILDIMIQSGSLKGEDDDNFSYEEKAKRTYCKYTYIIIFYYFWAIQIISLFYQI